MYTNAQKAKIKSLVSDWEMFAYDNVPECKFGKFGPVEVYWNGDDYTSMYICRSDSIATLEIKKHHDEYSVTTNIDDPVSIDLYIQGAREILEKL